MNDMIQAQSAGQGKGHNLTAIDREDILVRGVSEVVSFDEANIRLVTTCGILNLEGEGLRVHVLNTKDGTIAVTGKLNGVLYEDPDTAPVSERSAKSRSRRFFGS